MSDDDLPPIRPGSPLWGGRYILDVNGFPVPEPDLMKWAIWVEDDRNRRIAHTIIDHVDVSTVFLGLDHSFGGKLPILYETLVFGGSLDHEIVRYCTRQEAVDGHHDMVRRVVAARVIDNANHRRSNETG
jgi:hypothetical protein